MQYQAGKIRGLIPGGDEGREEAASGVSAVPAPFKGHPGMRGNMAARLFGAIDVGSYELELKIFEISKKNGVRTIDDVVRRLDLGTDTYNYGKLSLRRAEELKKVMLEFRRIMDNYGVEAYKACGTSAIRELTGASIILGQIENATGIHVDILGNAEQRFLDYKSIAFRSGTFEKMIETGTAILDIGSGSIQLSLISIGVLRLYEQVSRINAPTAKFESLVEELCNSRLKIFKHLYLEKRKIDNIIVVDDYISDIIHKPNVEGYLMELAEKEGTKTEGSDLLSIQKFNIIYDQIKSANRAEAARMLEIAEENVPMAHISAIIMRCVCDMMKVENLWLPGVVLCDGMMYEYAETQKILTFAHNFEQDIIASAQEISRRYNGSLERSRTLEKIALKIFDSTKRFHSLGDRERLLLQISAILHDCGKFISMNNLSDCAYQIIMNTEIIGISRLEREIIANVVRFNHADFVYYEKQSRIGRDAYMTITKLTAILRVANGLDRSHKHKFGDFKIRVKEDQLIITVDSKRDITLEKGLFERRADFFEEIFSIRPVIKQKKD